MRITREQLYAAFDVTGPNAIFVDIEEKDEDSIKFYIDGNKETMLEIRHDGVLCNPT